MFDVRRYLSMEPWLGLVTMISDRTYLNLEPTNCSLESLVSLGGLVTKVTIGTNRSTSSAQLLPELPKLLEYTFTRLNPNSFFRTSVEPLVIDNLTMPTSTQAILDRLSALTGVVFDIDDFEQLDVPNFGTATLVSKPTSLRWVGSLAVTLVNTRQRTLASALTVKSSPAVFRPLGQTGRVADFVYCAAHNFTPFRYDLGALIDSPNGVLPQRLAFILKQVTGDDWKCQDAPTQWNICTKLKSGLPTFEIIYAGPPIKLYTLRTDKRSVIVLRIDQTRCTGLSGLLLLHYD
ncbi:hypothetical protein D3C87_1176230 [compost metagenome]